MENLGLRLMFCLGLAKTASLLPGVFLTMKIILWNKDYSEIIDAPL